MKERILAYADEISVQPGQQIAFKVSSPFDGSYRAEIVRLRSSYEEPGAPGLKEEVVTTDATGSYPARVQPIHAGSHVDVPDAGAFAASSFSMQCLVWATRPGPDAQALMGTWDAARAAGCALALDETGKLSFTVGDGADGRDTLTLDAPLLERHWYLVGASYDAERSELRLSQIPCFQYAVGSETIEQSRSTSVKPDPGRSLRFAAWHDGDRPAAHFNGKLEAPRVVSRALDRGEIEALRAVEIPPSLVADLVGAWDFAEEISSTRVIDRSPHARHGSISQLPARAVCGERWDGTIQRWTDAPEHYAAIHFHDDDLYDCGWDTDFDWTVPDGQKSGFYAAKLTQGDAESYVPFYVRPRRGTSNSKLCVLIPTATYYAYANARILTEWDFFEHVMNRFLFVDQTSQYLHLHPELGISTYDCHTDGSGGAYSSRLRPMLNIRPRESRWVLNTDTQIFDWLEALGFDYDVVTDDDLEAEGPALLEPYSCVMTCTHPEYYSRNMLESLFAYRDGGGRLMYMGGNGFYWKVSYHPDLPGVIEMRRAEDGCRAWIAEPGEYYHSFDAELGGMWRRSGIPPQSLVGSGFTSQGFDSATHYNRTAESFDPRVSFIFEGIGDDERIGDFEPHAAAVEIDRADPALGTPPHALIVAVADDFSAGWQWVAEEHNHPHTAIDGETNPLIRCDMMFFEAPNGGAVFSTSSIGWSYCLFHDDYRNNVSRITENVLRRFLDPKSF